LVVWSAHCSSLSTVLYSLLITFHYSLLIAHHFALFFTHCSSLITFDSLFAHHSSLSTVFRRTMAEEKLTPEEMLNISLKPGQADWMEPSASFKKGTYCYSAPLKHQKYLDLPNQREWQPHDPDWKLPENWKEIIIAGMGTFLKKHRSFRLYLDICVRCGACADKCHYFIGSGDPKNMPVLRAELLRSVYRRYFTLGGRIFGKLAGARELT
jgi:hypothetical protein